MRPWLSVAGTRWTRCTPEFPLQPGEHVAPGDLGNALARPPKFAVRVVQHLEPPAMGGSVFLIHGEEFRGEQRGLVAAGGGADLQDGTPLVRLVARQEGDADLVAQARQALAKIGQLGLCQLAHVGIGQQGLRFPLRPLGGAQLVDAGDDRLKLGEFLAGA